MSELEWNHLSEAVDNIALLSRCRWNYCHEGGINARVEHVETESDGLLAQAKLSSRCCHCYFMRAQNAQVCGVD